MERVKLLSEYGTFLKENYIGKLAEENRQFLAKVNLHLIKSGQEFSKSELLKMSVKNMTELLEAFEKGKITREGISKILELELEALPGLKPEFIDSNDLLSIYTAQKQALLSFIPKFSSDQEITKKLTEELELTFLLALDFTIESYVKQRIKSVTKLTESKVREKTANLYIKDLANQKKELEDLQEELKISCEEVRTQNENLLNLQQALITRQEDLVDKEIELTRSNQYLDQFASLASHDLKEPLRMVKQYVKLISRRYGDILDQNGKEFIGFAIDGAERMEQMIKSILDYAKLNKLGIFPEISNVEKILETAKQNLEVAIEESGAEISHGPLPILNINSTQLTRIFQNLLSNAIKYRAGGNYPKIHIMAKKKEGTWIFSVRDNGIGIAPDNFERIFHPFQRLHTLTEYEGIGLGLYFLKKIVAHYGGDIWVESEMGKGSTFFFTVKETEPMSLLVKTGLRPEEDVV